MKIIRKLALAAVAGAMALGVAGTTAASAGTGPSGGVQVVGGNTAMEGHVTGPTYLNEHGRNQHSQVIYEPSKFYLIGGGSAQIFSTSTYWSSWGKNHAVGHGYMWGVRNGHKVYVGQVTMRFWQRRTDGYFIATGQQYAFFGKVQISGILPGNGGSVQRWHWSWRSDNWVFGG
jgi:hypothetical protein